jgi:hypothetical protein
MIRFVSAAVLIVGAAACKAGSERNSVDTSASATSTAAPAPAPAPTGTGAARVDTAAGALAQPTSTTERDSVSARRDTTGAKTSASAGNQTQSGVTNAKTGKSTLGPGVKKTEPTQGQPVTSKGDTLVRRKKP